MIVVILKKDRAFFSRAQWLCAARTQDADMADLRLTTYTAASGARAESVWN